MKAKFTFKKAGRNSEGMIVNVFTGDGNHHIGTVEKWAGLFIGKDWRGDKVTVFPSTTRTAAACELLDHFEFELSETMQAGQ